MADEQNKNQEKPANNSNNHFERMLTGYVEFFRSYTDRLKNNYSNEQEDELEFIEIQGINLINASGNLKNEMMKIYNEVDSESKYHIDNHINNTGINQTLLRINSGLKKGVFGSIMDKIKVISEFVKKVIQSINEYLKDNDLFPKIQKIIGFIVDLFELLDNIFEALGKMLDGLTDFSGAKISSNAYGNLSYLRMAEDHFLSTHTKWQSLKKG
ncbi:MAG TPA: hypothetical protein PKE39_00655 [Ignavibacteria bacterium]|nr:hypothetical protein [Ignavibacteria bacterium]HMQ97505.1 hypothetical protein [Ignavibacteria bacterium]